MDKYKKKQSFEVRPYKFKELACIIYQVDPRTFKRWLKPFENEIGILEGGYYKIPQVEKIIEKLGLPYKIDLEEDFEEHS